MFLLGTAEKQFLELMQLPTNIKTLNNFFQERNKIFRKIGSG